MVSQMHVVQNAARLAMADHRAAGPRRPRSSPRTVFHALLAMLAAGLGWRLTAGD